MMSTIAYNVVIKYWVQRTYAYDREETECDDIPGVYMFSKGDDPVIPIRNGYEACKDIEAQHNVLKH
jgi:hypothetical protein